MTSPPPDARTAAVLVEDALALIFPGDLVARLRPDSPLTAVGMTPADAVCVSDAVASLAERSGLSCRLTDADLEGTTAVADLVDAVQRRLREEADA